MTSCDPNKSSGNDPSNPNGNKIDPLSDKGVVINGYRWATRNVAAPGTFADKLESTGMYYLWDRNVGWSATDPIQSSDGSAWINYNSSLSSYWKDENNPCPKGWFVPSRNIFDQLIDAGFTWTTVNKVGGLLLGSGDDTIFLPAAGLRLGDSDGKLYNVGTSGGYWSSMQYDKYNAYSLVFFGNDPYSGHHTSKSSGRSVRCVKAE